MTTNVVRPKSLKCIEWTVETADRPDTLVSETFLLMHRECNLKLTLGRREVTTYATSYLYFNYCGEMNSPINVSVRVANDPNIVNNQPQAIKYIAATNTAIWSSTYGHLLRNALLTFEVVIYADTSTEDRSIQTASYLNADVSKESLLKDFSELLDTGINHDVEIKCKEHSIKTHKTVLCARSDVFRAMLRSDMLEGHTSVVEIQDVDASYFQDFVRYLYSDTMPELTFDKAKVLYEAGDKYNIKSLMLQCSEYFQDFLTPENIFECFTLADAHSDVKLKDKIISYILEEKVFLQKEYWLPFYENYPKVALEVYKLSYEKN